MKPLFSVYGYGLGHATRVEAILSRLTTDYLITASGDAYDYFRRRGFNPYRINSFRIGNFINSFSWIQTLFQNVDFPIRLMSDFNLFKRLVSEYKPDLLVSDTEPVSLSIAESLRISNAFLSNLVPIAYEYDNMPSEWKTPSLNNQARIIKLYLERVLAKSDLIISPTMTKYNAGFKVKFTDLIVRSKPRELSSINKIMVKEGLPKKYVLVSFGGASITSEYYESIIPVLKEFKNTHFVVSTNNAVRRVIKLQNITLLPFINNFLEYLKGAQALITLAGHSTLSEAIVYNKPILAIPIREHVEQLVNAYLVKRNGFGEVLITNNLTKSSVRNALTLLLDNKDEFVGNERKSRFKGDGASEIAGLIQNFKK